MAKRYVMVPAEEVDLSTVKYDSEAIQGREHTQISYTQVLAMNWGLFSNVCGLLAAPHLTGFVFKLFVRIIEAPVIGSLIVSHLKKQNRFVQVCFLFLGFRFFLT
jgi:hypothetical protein